MKDFLLVAMPNALKQLVGKAFDDQRIHAFFLAKIIHKLFQVVLEIFENKDEFPVGVDDFSQVDDIDMVELFENGDFSNGCRRDALLLRLQSDLFQRENLACFLVYLTQDIPLAL